MESTKIGNITATGNKAIDKTGLDNILFEEFDDILSKKHIFLCNMLTGVSRWSKGAVEYFGLPGEYMEKAGLIWSEYIHPDDREVYLKEVDDVFTGRKTEHKIDYRAKNANGEYIICSCHGRVVKDTHTGIKFFLGTIENHVIIDRVDATTNLYNIYEFSNKMEYYKKNKIDISVLEIGINNFSNINDVYGYLFGNRVLREFASLIYSVVREAGGMIFRMNGVRFACCFTGNADEIIKELYDTLRKIAHHRIIIDGTRISVTISGGVSYFEQIHDENTVLNSVEYALYQSKHKKHGQLVIYEDKNYRDNYKTLECLETIKDSVMNGFEGVYLCYQPIISSDDERLIGAEALLRWHKEPIGEVPPGVFVPWLENDPCFFELGNWILRTAMLEAKSILVQYPDFVLNINLAYPQLSNSEFMTCLKEIIDETGFPPQNLCLELTERCRQLGTKELQVVVERLKSMGIKVALDDFGTGFSSLNLLCTIPIDTLKIDRLFILDIQESRANQAVVEAISECARKLNIHICTEGVENREMIVFLKRYPVYSYQGYYYSKPIPINNFKNKYKVS